MAQTVDEFFNSPSQVSARRTRAIREKLAEVAPGYGQLSDAAERMMTSELDPTQIQSLKDFAESRDIRPLVNAKPGTSGKILSSGQILTIHDLKGLGTFGLGATEPKQATTRASYETEQGLPFYDASKGETDPIRGLRPLSGENVPKNLSDIMPSEFRAIYGEDVPIMHPYAYGGILNEKETGFGGFGRGADGKPGERIILRPEVSGRTSITTGDYLTSKRPSIPLDDIYDPKKASALLVEDFTRTLVDNSSLQVHTGQSVADYVKSGSNLQFETMTLGVGMEDIQAMIVSPRHVGANELSTPLRRLSEMNKKYGVDFDIGRMIHQSEQRILAQSYGIDYVQHIPVLKAEMHNPAMTKEFLSRYGLRGVDIGDIDDSMTPLQGLLTQVKAAVDSGQSDIKALEGMTEADRGFVSKTIGEHLSEYEKSKSYKYSGSMDRVNKLNVGSISDIKKRLDNPLTRTMKKVDTEVSARVASNSVPETVAEATQVAVRKSAATKQLIEASSAAAQAVSTKNSLGMRLAGAASTILRKRLF